MKTARVVACLAVCVIALSSVSSSAATNVNWPQFRFDKNHTGRNPAETILNRNNVSSLSRSWQAQLGTLVDFSSPAVVDGVVYIGSTDGRLWAYPADGCGQSLCTTPLWSSVNLGQIIDSPTVVNGTVYIGSQTSVSSNDGKINAFSAAGCGAAVCAPMWQGSAGTQSAVLSSPTVANGVVYAGRNTGEVLAWPAGPCGRSSCTNIWSGLTDDPIVSSSPTVVNGKVYVGSADSIAPESISGRLFVFELP